MRLFARPLLPLAALAAVPAGAQDALEPRDRFGELADPLWTCGEAETQVEMNWCAGQDFQEADLLLNAQWARTVEAMHRRDGEEADAPHFASLLAAQRAWIAFRDAHCASEGLLYRGGSIAPLVVSTCKTDLTRQRIMQLQRLENPE